MQKLENLNQKSTVLCVDLDGTLIRSDMLLESLCGLIKQQPFKLCLLPFWCLKGRANLKAKLAEHYTFDASALPYRQEVLELVRSQKEAGSEVYLATASNEIIAKKIAEHLGYFNAVLASNEKNNLKGKSKLEALQQTLAGRSFDYIGDSKADLLVWQASQTAYVVENQQELSSQLSSSNTSIKPIKVKRQANIFTIIKALRVHQWVKNLLIFLPLFLAHQAADVGMLLQAFIGFLAFCACSSAVYLLNDLLDLEADRLHHSKQRRPFASGNLSLAFGLVAVPLLLILSATLSAVLYPKFAVVLLSYFVLTTWYSVRLKQIVLVDILVLAALYTIRIIAGGEAVAVAVSEWLLAFSMFFFLSLACVKRYSELLVLRKANKQEAKGRGYVASDLEMIGQFGSAAGYMSVLVLALYVSSHEVSELYRTPRLLWLLCPLILFWISRTWLIAHRGNLHDDPIVFAISDKASYLIGSLAFLLLFFAI